jgi:hypothetical protein
MKILLDYLFPITAIEPTPAASTAFLKQVLCVGKPKDGGVTQGVITLCTSQAAVDALVGAQAAAEIGQLFAAGMTRVYVMPNADLSLAAELAASNVGFYTILITSDFTDANVTAADFGEFEGVIGVSSTDDAFLAVQAAIANRCAFHVNSTNKAKNLFYAFGKLLSNALNWKNQQYVPMPLADDVATLGAANALFDDRISFVISDDEFANRLAMFCAGGKAITAPYIERNLAIDIQSKALQYISGNQPAYTKTAAALLEDELQKIIQSYLDIKWIDAGTVEISLVQDNFVASGDINIAEPKALWRIFGEMRENL